MGAVLPDDTLATSHGSDADADDDELDLAPEGLAERVWRVYEREERDRTHCEPMRPRGGRRGGATNPFEPERFANEVIAALRSGSSIRDAIDAANADLGAEDEEPPADLFGDRVAGDHSQRHSTVVAAAMESIKTSETASGPAVAMGVTPAPTSRRAEASERAEHQVQEDSMGSRVVQWLKSNGPARRSELVKAQLLGSVAAVDSELFRLRSRGEIAKDSQDRYYAVGAPVSSSPKAPESHVNGVTPTRAPAPAPRVPEAIKPAPALTLNPSPVQPSIHVPPAPAVEKPSPGVEGLLRERSEIIQSLTASVARIGRIAQAIASLIAL